MLDHAVLNRFYFFDGNGIELEAVSYAPPANPHLAAAA